MRPAAVESPRTISSRTAIASRGSVVLTMRSASNDNSAPVIGKPDDLRLILRRQRCDFADDLAHSHLARLRAGRWSVRFPYFVHARLRPKVGLSTWWRTKRRNCPDANLAAVPGNNREQRTEPKKAGTTAMLERHFADPADRATSPFNRATHRRIAPVR